MIPVPEVDDMDVVFGSIKHMPEYGTIPDDFKKDRNPYVEIQSTWFFQGLDPSILIAKEGVDKAKALKALRAIQVSFEPKHEHKQAGVAYLMSEWFTINTEQ